MSSFVVFPLVLAGWIFSLCLHEFSHAAIAYRGGDRTVATKGYLSFNPLRYVHPQFSIVMPLIFLFLGGLGLPGGAVYIEHDRLKSPKWESAVSLAGPLSNALLALLLAIPFRLLPGFAVNNPFGAALAFLVFLQVSAVILNLLPIPGLDGFGIISPFLPRATRQKVATFGRQASMLLLVLFFIPGFNGLFWSSVSAVTSLLGVPMELSSAGLHAFRFWA